MMRSTKYSAASRITLTAGGKNCQSAFSGLPGYPGALAMEADGTLYISYRWARSCLLYTSRCV